MKNTTSLTTDAQPTADLVPLSTIVGEFASMPTVDHLARQLAADVVLDDIGRRCISAELACVLLDSEHARRAEHRDRARRTQADNADRREAQSEARARRALARRLQAMALESAVDSGADPVQVMIARDGKPVYDGDRNIPRPSAIPFLFEEGGGAIGPPRRPRRSKKAES